jgi:hypothetical protein
LAEQLSSELSYQEPWFCCSAVVGGHVSSSSPDQPARRLSPVDAPHEPILGNARQPFLIEQREGVAHQKFEIVDPVASRVRHGVDDFFRCDFVERTKEVRWRSTEASPRGPIKAPRPDEFAQLVTMGLFFGRLWRGVFAQVNFGGRGAEYVAYVGRR